MHCNLVAALDDAGDAERLPGRYSLFTGSALFAADCIEAKARYPLVERL